MAITYIDLGNFRMVVLYISSLDSSGRQEMVTINEQENRPRQEGINLTIIFSLLKSLPVGIEVK
jgi:hypothetical protein